MFSFDVAILAQKLKIFTKNNFKSSAELARKLDMTPQSFKKYLDGERAPGSEILNKLSQLGCDINWLLNGEKTLTEKLTVNEIQEKYEGDPQRAALETLKMITEDLQKIKDHLKIIE